MTKKKFLKELKSALRGLKKEECDKYIGYYEEMIADLMENGETEEQAVKKQGSVKKLAEEILRDAEAEQRRPKDKWGIILMVCTVLLAVFSLVCILALPEAGVISLVKDKGPTAVFVAGKIKEPVILYLITAVVALITICYFIKKKKMWGILIGILVFLVVGGTFLFCRITKKDSDTSEQEKTLSGMSYDENDVIKCTEEVIALLNAEDFETLQRDYAAEEMKAYFTKDYMEEAKKMVNEDWGSFVSNGNIYIGEVEENHVAYVIATVNSMYENVSVTYTVTYDKEMKVAGFYMR